MPSIHTDPAHRALTAQLFAQLAASDAPEATRDADAEQMYALAGTLALTVRRVGWTPPPLPAEREAAYTQP